MVLTRVWELALGAVAYLIFNSGKSDLFALYIKKKLKFNLSLLGMGMIFYSFIFFSKETLFPGFAAIIPTVGTVLIIFSQKGSLIHRSLSKQIIVYIGRISYPLYLWHWPLFSFVFILNGSMPSIPIRIPLIFIAIILSIFTHEKIEKKLILSKNKKQTALKILLVNAVIAFSGYYTYQQNGFPSRFPKLVIQEQSSIAYRDSLNKKTGAPICKFFEDNNIEICNLDQHNKKPTIALIGDSHANHLFPGLSEYYRSKGENLLLLAKSSTTPFFGVISERNPPSNLDQALNYILNESSIKNVLLSAFWSNYYETKGTFVSSYFIKIKSNQAQ